MSFLMNYFFALANDLCYFFEYELVGFVFTTIRTTVFSKL